MVPTLVENSKFFCVYNYVTDLAGLALRETLLSATSNALIVVTTRMLSSMLIGYGRMKYALREFMHS